MSGHGKRPLDTEINLTPFIDLMAVTIAFLLITAEWSRAGALAAPMAGEGGQASAEPVITLVVTRAGLSIDRVRVPLEALGERLAGVQRVSIVVDDAVSYEALVEVMDVCSGANVTVSVSPASD